MAGTFRVSEWLYATLFDTKHGSEAARKLDKLITWLIISNLLALLLEHIPAIHEAHHESFAIFDRLSIYFFTLEFLLRLMAAPADPAFAGKSLRVVRHFFTPFALIDFLVVAPYWLHLAGLVSLDLRALRVLRLLRLLKLLRDFFPALMEFRIANRGRSLRQKVNSILNETPTSGRLHQQVDLILIFFIILSVICVFLETVPEVHEPLRIEFYWLDIVSVAVFSVEYLLRVYVAPEQGEDKSFFGSRLAFIKKPSSIVDLIAVAPFYLQFMMSLDLRFIRILRVLRVIKLTRYNTALKTFGLVMKREKRAFAAAMFITMLITVLAAAIVYEVEHGIQPDKFDTMLRAMYWAVITLASVGYGDISPITPVGQALTMLLALLGIGIVALPAGILGSAFTDQLRQDREEMLQEIEAAFADGVLTEDEATALEEERIRLHLTSEQFEKLKSRAIAKIEGPETGSVNEALEHINKAKAILKSLQLHEAIVDINGTTGTESEKAALRSLLD